MISSLMISKIFSQENNPKNIHLTAFSLIEIPDSITGTSCAFSVSKTQYEVHKFLFFDDLIGTCLISIDHKLVFMQEVGDKFTNGFYTVYIQKEKKMGELDECYVLKTELVVLNRKGNKLIKKV